MSGAATAVAEQQAASAAAHGDILFHLGPLPVSSAVTTAWAIIAVLGLLSYLATRRLDKVPSGLQNFLEWVVEYLEGHFTSVLGPKRVKQYLPFVGSFFLFIIISNYSGILPGAGHLKGLAAPTSHLGYIAGMSLIVFFSYHYFGIRTRGVNYLKHLADPPFLLPLNIVDELVRPMSLTLRLFGNIYGGEAVLVVMLSVLPYFLPSFMMGLELIFGYIQALIFSTLAAVYIAGATELHEEEETAHQEAAQPTPVRGHMGESHPGA
ncbi:MAG TPA: F0F1 ATP synthase subunit A [Firmicutes bacterium]|nr:F0F1 ATP synthase subunit A [Bacillota bacterium]